VSCHPEQERAASRAAGLACSLKYSGDETCIAGGEKKLRDRLRGAKGRGGSTESCKEESSGLKDRGYGNGKGINTSSVVFGEG
jgi:hypothetical protein